MKQPLLSNKNGDPFQSVWSGFHDAVLRPALSIIQDGSGFRPATPADYGSLLYASGITITGIVNVEQRQQIVGSGNIDSSPVVIVDTSGNLNVVVANFPEKSILDVTGSVSITNFPSQFGISGLTAVSGAVSVSNFPTGIAITNFPAASTVGVTGNVSVSNFPTGIAVSNFPSEVVASVSFANDSVVTESGVAVRLPSLLAVKGIMLVASLTNQGNVYIGGSGVTAKDGIKRGITLVAGGMPSQLLPVKNSNLLWINADNSGDAVGILAF